MELRMIYWGPGAVAVRRPLYLGAINISTRFETNIGNFEVNGTRHRSVANRLSAYGIVESSYDRNVFVAILSVDSIEKRSMRHVWRSRLGILK
jgi:hypothetical protein